MVPIFDKCGQSPVNPTPSPQDLREAFRLIGEMCSAWHQVADLCAEHTRGGTKEQVTRLNAGGLIIVVTSHWLDDFQTVLLQSARSRQQLLDSITVLDFERQHLDAHNWGVYFFEALL